MLITARVAGTALLTLTLIFGWPLLFTSMMGYICVSAPALLAAWAAAWFGDEVGDLINLGPDGLIRGFGLFMLVVMGLIVAAARWHWFS